MLRRSRLSDMPVTPQPCAAVATQCLARGYPFRRAEGGRAGGAGEQEGQRGEGGGAEGRRAEGRRAEGGGAEKENRNVPKAAVSPSCDCPSWQSYPSYPFCPSCPIDDLSGRRDGMQSKAAGRDGLHEANRRRPGGQRHLLPDFIGIAGVRGPESCDAAARVLPCRPLLQRAGAAEAIR